MLLVAVERDYALIPAGRFKEPDVTFIWRPIMTWQCIKGLRQCCVFKAVGWSHDDLLWTDGEEVGSSGSMCEEDEGGESGTEW